MAQADTESTAPAPEAHPVPPGGLADVESARAALPEAVFSMEVFEALEMAKAYVGALNIMSCDEDLDGRFNKPMWRLVCDVSDLLDKIEQEATKVYNLARRASGLPDLPDGNGEIEEADGDATGADHV